MSFPQITDVGEPSLKWAMIMHFKSSLDSSTAVVACDDNIFDVEGLDRILQYSQEVDV